MNIKTKKSLFWAVGAGFLLLFLYFLILVLANSFSHALEQFNQFWYWILLLIIGFGLQVGLYSYIRNSFINIKKSTTLVVSSGAVSTGSMVLCCFHHLADILPLMGLAIAATFLVQYQLFFIIVGVFSNLIGIILMLEIIQKHNLATGFLQKFLIYDMNKIKKATISSSLIFSAVAFISIGGFLEKETNSEIKLSQEQEFLSENLKTRNLAAQTDTRNKISFEVSPVDFNFDSPLKFEIKIDTHSGSLDFDLRKISVLEDDKDNKYQPLDWQGSSVGGHHRSGILIFPELNSSVKTIKLIIKENSDSLRIFEWDLPR